MMKQISSFYTCCFLSCCYRRTKFMRKTPEKNKRKKYVYSGEKFEINLRRIKGEIAQKSFVINFLWVVSKRVSYSNVESVEQQTEKFNILLFLR